MFLNSERLEVVESLQKLPEHAKSLASAPVGEADLTKGALVTVTERHIRVHQLPVGGGRQ